MAVTQQLARISAEYLAACRRSAEESPNGDHRWDPPSADCLDLDWSPPMLRQAFELARLDAVHLEAINRATDGDTDLDLGFLNTHPHEIGFFGPTPTGLSPAGVAQVSTLLGEIDTQMIQPVLESAAGSRIGRELTGDRNEYLLGHFRALRDFYEGAAQRNLLVVLWWD
ncbi:DUF1877 domain-containing protein [Kitasatospora sp. NPDC057198]|uniref:DUF1877 domain-containing protein n=1 Tax=Kitasatospora sp. NPDC057198 TaxID=3346046 RepID=UPI0036377F46